MMQPVNNEKIRDAVREHYGQIAERALSGAASTCCSPTTSQTDGNCCDAGPDAGNDCCGASTLYETDLSELPTGISDASLGCGDPITIAALQPGQTVLDLGSGAGMDCFLAARRVGPEGRVIGVDMTPAMLQRAQQNRETLGLANVEFREGAIEALPVADESVDVVISNCVINLSPDKQTVFREAYRVLRSGGRLAVSDMVTLGRFSEAARADAASWAACISGAEDVADYVAAIRAAGFTGISVRDKAAPEVELVDTKGPHTNVRLFSARVTAIKQP